MGRESPVGRPWRSLHFRHRVTPKVPRYIPRLRDIHHRARDVGLPSWLCPVDADGGATRMSETGRPSRSLPPSGAPAAASASGTGSRGRDEAGVLPIRDARSAGVPETAIINHLPSSRNTVAKIESYKDSRIRGSFIYRTSLSDTARNPLRPGVAPHSIVDTESSFPALRRRALRFRTCLPHAAARERSGGALS